MEEFGFIILRCVTSVATDRYWKRSYDCIRKFYSCSIVIIDDNSRGEFLTEKEMVNTSVIASEFPGRGELLPYYYLLTNRWFKRAVFIHDSVFVNAPLNLESSPSAARCASLWDFSHEWNCPAEEVRLLCALKDPAPLLTLYAQPHLWKGCFGAMCVFDLDFIDEVDHHHDLRRLLDITVSRNQRCAFERVWAVIAQLYEPAPSILGHIHKYTPWGADFEHMDLTVPLTKVWSGR